MRRLVKVVGITVVTVGAASIVATLIVRDSISRHRRDLFSSRPLRRLAALGYIAGQPASVDLVLLLRDFITGSRKSSSVTALEPSCSEWRPKSAGSVNCPPGPLADRIPPVAAESTRTGRVLAEG